MLSLRSMLFLAGSAGGLVLSAVMLEGALSDRRALPLSPEPKTLEELALGPAPRWIELLDAVPLCDLEQDVGGNGAVPVVARARVDAPTLVLLLSLRESEFCPTLSSPLRIAPEESAYAARVLSQMERTSPCSPMASPFCGAARTT